MVGGLEVLTGLDGFLKILSDALGIIIEPRKRIAISEAEKKVAKNANEILNNTDYPTTFDDGLLKMQSTKEDILARAKTRENKRLMKKQNNLESVIGHTAKNIDEKDVLTPPTDEWVDRFFEYAENITTEKLQYLWGKVLAGELKKTGSFSLRTLDYLRSMSIKEAEEFQKILPISIIIGNGDRCIVDEHTLYRKFEIDYPDLIKLINRGLLNKADKPIGFSQDQNPSNSIFIVYNNNYFLLSRRTKENQIIRLTMYVFTDIAKEIASIITYKPADEYLQAMKDLLEKRDPSLSFEIEKLNPCPRKLPNCQNDH